MEVACAATAMLARAFNERRFLKVAQRHFRFIRSSHIHGTHTAVPLTLQIHL